MSATTIPPLHDWRRHYPTAKRIAQSLPRELLSLRTATLVGDIRERFRCSTSTAMKAVSIARN